MPVAGRQRRSQGVWNDAEIAARTGLNRREVAPADVIAVAAKILGRQLPIARHNPFVHAADDLDAAFSAVEERIEIPGHLPQIFAQWRRLSVKGREVQSFVIVQLRHWGQSPALAVQFAVISFLEIGHAGEPTVIAIGPAVIGTSETRGIADIGTAEAIA